MHDVLASDPPPDDDRRAPPRRAPPPQSPAQRDRAQLKRDLKQGRCSIDAVLSDPPSFIATAKVIDILRAMPGYGPVKANKIIKHASATNSARTYSTEAQLPADRGDAQRRPRARQNAFGLGSSLIRRHASPSRRCTRGCRLRRGGYRTSFILTARGLVAR
ncbi:MAG: hypothetical protein LC777_17525 [Actinobacteria bacterium]|nr:hypothetical protein [Actinomycetota bacterium]